MLEGSWELVEWTSSKDGELHRPRGRNASGRLIYSPDGYMSAFLAAADGSADALAYSGTWELRGTAEVVHRVSLATVATFVGAELVRTISWEDDDLVLTTPERDGWVNRLRWRRPRAEG